MYTCVCVCVCVFTPLGRGAEETRRAFVHCPHVAPGQTCRLMYLPFCCSAALGNAVYVDCSVLGVIIIANSEESNEVLRVRHRSPGEAFNPVIMVSLVSLLTPVSS